MDTAIYSGLAIWDRLHPWRAACRKVGVPGIVPHDLRRSAVRNLERSGVPRSVAMKMVGHKTEAIYRRYAIVAEADLVAGGEKLTNLHQVQGFTARSIIPFPESR